MEFGLEIRYKIEYFFIQAHQKVEGITLKISLFSKKENWPSYLPLQYYLKDSRTLQANRRNKRKFEHRYLLFSINVIKKSFLQNTKLGPISPNFTHSICASRFTPILLAHSVGRTSQKLSVYVALHTSKVEQIFVDETEECQRMTTGAFALRVRGLVKITPGVNFTKLLSRTTFAPVKYKPKT